VSCKQLTSVDLSSGHGFTGSCPYNFKKANYEKIYIMAALSIFLAKNQTDFPLTVPHLLFSSL